MTNPVIEVTAHCPRCGEQVVGLTVITMVGVSDRGVAFDMAKVYIDHQCRPPQDKR